MKPEVESFIEATRIRSRVLDLAQRIASDWWAGPSGNRSTYLIGVLNGASVFVADLARALTIPVRIDFLRVSSYGHSQESSGKVKLSYDPQTPIADQDVLLVEDIVDTGATASYLLTLLEQRRPRSLKLVTLLDKPERRITPVAIDYCGFAIPDRFVVGYGMDFAEDYRDLPYIGVLKKEK